MEVETQSEGEVDGRRRAAGIPGREAAFVGRARELATIRVAREQPDCGGVVIVGAPSVGKTRLARAALAEAEAAGAMSVWLRATASAASIPLAAVVDLLPDGAVAGDPLRHSNAEIAEQLVVSVRTVESHLYHAMAKLGVAQRGELGPALAAHGGAVSPA